MLLIAVFYSGRLDYSALLVAGVGIMMLLGLQAIGIGSAYAYVLPGAVFWVGLLWTGAHPALAGVVLGLMTRWRLAEWRRGHWLRRRERLMTCGSARPTQALTGGNLPGH